MTPQLSFSPTIFLIAQEPRTSRRIAKILSAQGLETLPQARLADVIKAARARLPAAVILDLASADAGSDPNTRMGADHILRVLRQTYPDLCVIALAAQKSAQLEMLSREFRVPLLAGRFESDALLAILESHGVVGNSGSLAGNYRPAPLEPRAL